MRTKLLSAVIAGALMCTTTAALAAGNGNSKGYLGGQNASFIQQQPQGNGENRGHGDGTMPRPMDGTGFGAMTAGNGNGMGQEMGNRYNTMMMPDQQPADGSAPQANMQNTRLRQQLGDKTGNPEDCPYYQERMNNPSSPTSQQE
jgi:hypothetical protein